MRLRGLQALICRRVRYRITLAGLLFALAVTLVACGAFLTGNNLLFLLFSAMLASILISGFLSRLVLAGLEVELLLPQHVAAREASPARLRIRNTKRWMPSLSIELSGRRDPNSGTPPILLETLYFPVVAGRSTVEMAAKVTFPYRGRHKENVFQLSTRFPFGFLRKTATVSLRRETTVYPALVPSPETIAALEAAAGELESKVRGTGLEFYSIRNYVPGDSARSVDWKSTAHTGELQVREFARGQRREIEIYLDAQIQPGGGDWFETALENCAWLIWNLGELEAELIFRSQRYSISLPGEGDPYDILKFLAYLEPVPSLKGAAPAEPPFDDSNCQIVFTARPSSFSAAGWRPAHLLSPSAVQSDAGHTAS